MFDVWNIRPNLYGRMLQDEFAGMMNMFPKSEEVFLATTALEEFWDTTRPVVFLGEWCLLYERRSYRESLNGCLLGSPYDDSQDGEKTYDIVDRIYEAILPLLAARLNVVHRTAYSNRYWRILLGPWLKWYLPVVYDRYMHLRKAINEFPNFTTICLSVESFVVPVDTLEFHCFISEDFYNLQLCSKILQALRKEFPCKKIDVPQIPLYAKLLGNSWARETLSNAMLVFVGVVAKLRKATLLRSTYFPKKVELQLASRSPRRVLLSWHKSSTCARFEYDDEKRNVLRTVQLSGGEFEQCLSTMLFADIPQCFVEGFHSVEKEMRRRFPERSRAIFSANGWYFDEAFKHWAARSAEAGSLLLGSQHGGNYGALKRMPSEAHETSIMDFYYSWGWGLTECRAKVVPMPATKLLGRYEIGSDANNKDILWAATSAPRYLVMFPFLPSHFREYLSWHIRFANGLPQDLMKAIRFRPHYQDHAWGILERVKDCIPEIRIEPWSVDFQTSLENCRLYVCDHLSTTFAEALAVRKPTILFWNPQANKLRSEAQAYFDLLVDCGILFDNPESAAAAVAAVYDDVEAWWNEPHRQEAIQRFCERFARTSSEAISIWTNELERVTDLPSPK